MRDFAELHKAITEFEPGEPGALQTLFDASYQFLLNQARALRADPRDVSETASLVNELVESLLEKDAKKPGSVSFEGPAQFLAFIQRALRNTLVDRIRRRRRKKAGGDHVIVSIDNAALPAVLQTTDYLDLAAALDALHDYDERTWRVSENKLHNYLTTREIATSLGIGVSTVEADWTFAKAWLSKRLGGHHAT
jgi:RNA polymerase sigma factor (TIGR02999 family)